ncbi:MAG: family 78 glycoside hydrolase catalytic domain, partial [Humibacter sp.]
TLYFRGDIELPTDVVRARAYASALGWYRLFVNDSDITGHALVPRWTSLDSEVEYQVYDITDAVREGRNTVGVVVGDGRFRGRNGFTSRGAIFGDRLAALVQIEAERADGTLLTLGSDRTWTVGSGRIRTADPKHGERVDARLPTLPWHAADWSSQPVVVTSGGGRRLIAEDVERLQAVDRRPGTVIRADHRGTLVDFGQNFAGTARVRLRGRAGTRVKLSYSEVLTGDGDLDTHYLDLFGTSKDWFQRDEVTLGDEPLDYTSWFSIFGFRYLLIESDVVEEPITIDQVEGVVLSTPLRPRASFHTSHDGLNQLWNNVGWSLRSNFLDTATDCPTRERSGWTGDVQIFAPTASIMTDSDTFLRRWLHTLALDQLPDGAIPTVIPREWSKTQKRAAPPNEFGSAVGWGDAAVMVPMTLHTYFDDVDALRAQYASACAWVDHLAGLASSKRGIARRFGRQVGDLENFIVDTGRHYGEWLRPGENMVLQMIGNTLRPPAEVATAYLSNSARLLAKMATIIGELEAAARYERLAANARAAYRAAFVTHGGRRIGADKQDDYVRAIAFGLIEGAEIEAAVGRLGELIDDAGGHLATGFLSTPLLLGVLADHGRSDLAYEILLAKTAPSWLAQIERGATTVWETWEGYDRKGAARSSHNHYAFGSVAQWMIEYIVGIRPLEPGYRRFLISPTVGGGLTTATGRVDTGYGEISASWELVDGAIELELGVPPSTTAEVRIAGSTRTLPAGVHLLREPLGEGVAA